MKNSHSIKFSKDYYAYLNLINKFKVKKVTNMNVEFFY
jgi:hypothetical protein